MVGLTIMLLAAHAVLLSGCGDSGSSGPVQSNEGMLPEAVAVRKAFESAEPSLRYPVLDSLKLVEREPITPQAYSDALPSLRRLTAAPDLTAEQKQALETLIQRLQSLMSSGKVR